MDAKSINHLIVNTPRAGRVIKQFRDVAIKKLGGKCARCGFSDLRAIQIDHIAGNGAAERREYGRAAPLIICKKIAAGSTAYQLLCANCNAIKALENGERRRGKHFKKDKERRIYYDLNGIPKD